MNTILCPRCANVIEIDKAFEAQIESRLLIETKERYEDDLKKAKTAADSMALERMNQQLEIELEKSKLKSDLEYEKLKSELKREAAANSDKQELLIEQLRDNAVNMQEANKELREEIKKLNKSLFDEQKAKANAELEAGKKINEEAAKIREEVRKEADESHRLKELELQKQLNDTKLALDAALRKAEQGSEQIQGEVLELELERLLRSEFAHDEIEEVKKGQRGADIRQHVKDQRLNDCGLLIWEVKNAKWNKDWITKIKDDIRASKADIGIIVSRDMPDTYSGMQSVESNVWVVKPKLVLALAHALRQTVILVHRAGQNLLNKDEKMEILYKFLTGVEFKNRIEAIIDNYNTLQQEMENEKRQAERRWGKQEKAIRAVIGNTYGLYGDLQGIAGSELSIPLLEDSGNTSL